MRVLVIGIVFTDIKGFPFSKYDPLGTNKGEVLITHGGVSRNVAEDMAALGAEVGFLTIFDDTPLGLDMRTHLDECGVDLNHVLTVPDGGMGMWLAVFDESGNLAGSVSKMPDVAPLEEALRLHGDALFRDVDAVVAEFDTSEETARLCCELSRKYKKPLYVIVGNMGVILGDKKRMRLCDCVIMNEIEAGRLFDTRLLDLSPENALDTVSRKAQGLGIRRIIVTMGKNGCVYADFDTGEKGTVPALPCRVVDTTGAGDSFFSEAVLSLTAGMGLRQACERGARIAARVVQTEQSVCTKEDARTLDE